MAILGKRGSPPIIQLRKDARTPHGAIWSYFASKENAHVITEGRLLDQSHLLNIGDIINIRRPGHRTVSLRVRNREGNYVVLERVKH